MTKPSPHGVTLRARKHSRCYRCEKRILRTHTFFAASFPAAHALRDAWMRVTTEVCQSCAP